jgi:hypothetical protein
MATGSWVERNHARIRRKYFRPEQDPNAERRILARVRLAEIRANVSAAEWSLLVAVAVGVGYQEMAGMTVGGTRTRMARLRARLRASGLSN